MRNTFIFTLSVSLLFSPSWSETSGDISGDIYGHFRFISDLVERNDTYYKKFTDTPFTGEVSGIENGSINNGRKNGE